LFHQAQFNCVYRQTKSLALTFGVPAPVDLSGKIFGRWEVLGPSERRNEIRYWFCRCECGIEKWVRSQALANGGSRSCGCLFRELARQRFLKILDGRRFGRLHVLSQNQSKRKRVFWLCQCDCARRVWVSSIALLSGSTKSCGCMNRELTAKRARLLLKRHRVVLSEGDRRRLVADDSPAARIILLADESNSGPGLTDEQIAKRLGVTRMKIEYTRVKFAAPHEIKRRTAFALQQMARDPRRQQLRVEARRRYDAKPASKIRKAEYRKTMPSHVREHKRIYTRSYKRRPEVRLRENERERAWRRTPEGKRQKRIYVERRKPRANAKYRERYRTDINFRLRHALRSRIGLVLRQRRPREESVIELIGCSINDLRLHPERLFKPGMTWENHGQWHIDHVVPCAHFDLTDPGARKQCFHFSNLQPLWAAENIRKGGGSKSDRTKSSLAVWRLWLVGVYHATVF
jgi:hypothetical protein